MKLYSLTNDDLPYPDDSLKNLIGISICDILSQEDIGMPERGDGITSVRKYTLKQLDENGKNKIVLASALIV